MIATGLLQNLSGTNELKNDQIIMTHVSKKTKSKTMTNNTTKT